VAGKVFISYRRSETSWAARAVFERLWREFPQRVFIDLESISLGADFTRIIDEHLRGCEAMLALIGPQWLAELNQRKQHDETDFVRMEVARALLKDVPVVPVLLDGASMPKRRELPDDLWTLTTRNGLPIRAETFEAQMLRVVHEVRNILKLDVVVPVAVPAATKVTPLPSVVPPVGAAPLALEREAWMHDAGEDSYGRWADIKVRNVVQRMRWIEPGEFWMGSTEAERKRIAAHLPDDQKTFYDCEKPRHRVTLTHGFWLADTSCTQAMWQAITGENPSRFTGHNDLPVEQVSWDEVATSFLPELSRLLAAVTADLPSEAEWEYACRAGTDTAYAFGDGVNTDQVNFDGNHPPPGGTKGRERGLTVPVKTLAANGWGLHQMHGNVWEWCNYSIRTYSGRAERDPLGQNSGTYAVVRGGSFHFWADFCRSAARRWLLRKSAEGDLGFRFALRPTGLAGKARWERGENHAP
jgi:formylglycine-generating enzyme